LSDSTSKRVLEIVQYGLGGVGKALLGQIAEHAPAIQSQLGVELRYRALVNSSTVLQLEDKAALSNQYLQELATGLTSGQTRLADQPGAVRKSSDLAVLETALERRKGEGQETWLVVVDVSGASETLMGPVVLTALQQGQRAALANKRVLCGPIENYRQLMAAAGPGAQRLRYETTAGAALPVISTLQALLSTQDKVSQISGAFSGTLGYLTSRLEEGASYSQAVTEAKEKGYTEPDPRDDLGGLDVARKALILARLLGSSLELQDVAVGPLYPPEMADLSIPDFMQRIGELDAEYASRRQDAAEQGKVLRYVATVGKERCRVGLEQVNRESPLGNLRGTDNIIIYNTARYDSRPLVVQGPGAGAELTASGVLADILSFAR
jgi:homoserine dehydrogenase